MENKRDFKTIRILLTVFIIIVLGIFLWQITPFMLKLSTEEGQIAFKNKISDLGFMRSTNFIWFAGFTNTINSFTWRTI